MARKTTAVVAIPAQGTVEDAVRLMLEHHVSALPVVDDEGKLVGLISEGDLMRRLNDGRQERKSWWLELVSDAGRDARDFVRVHSHRIADVMTRKVITVSENTPVGEIARTLERDRISRVPVVRNGKLVGIVNRSNLLQGLSLAPAGPEPSTDDRVIRARILEVLADVPGIQASLSMCWSATVLPEFTAWSTAISRPMQSAWPPKRLWAGERSKSSWAAFRRGATAVAFDAENFGDRPQNARL